MHRSAAFPALFGLIVGLAACGGSAEPPSSAAESAPTVPSTAALHGTWDYVLDEEGRDVILADFTSLVDSADTVVTRIGFDGNDWWLGFLFDGELFLLDGAPEGDGGTFTLDPSQPVIVMTGAHCAARITYELAIDGDSLTLTALEECVVDGAEETCLDDRSEMEPLMLLVTEQTFIRSGDDPGY